MQVCRMDLRVVYRIVRSYFLKLTRNNGSEPKNIVHEGGLSQGEKSGFSLLSSRLCTLRPPVSSIYRIGKGIINDRSKKLFRGNWADEDM